MSQMRASRRRVPAVRPLRGAASPREQGLLMRSRMPKPLSHLRWTLAAASAACLALAACDDDPHPIPDGGGKLDAAADQAPTPDTGADRGADTTPDSTGDTSFDQTSDTTAGDTGDTGGAASAAGFEVTVALRPDTRPGFPLPGGVATLPATDSFTLFVTTEGQPRLVASRQGRVSVSPLAREAAGWRTTRNVLVGPTAGYDGLCNGFGTFTYERIEGLAFTASGITATVHGTASYITGDVVQALPFTGALTGKPDVTPPAVTFTVAKPHPLDGVMAVLSEAAPLATTARLEAADGTRVALKGEPATEDPFQTRFWSPTPLRPDTRYTLVFEPPLVDLAGNPGSTAAVTVTTAAVPLIPEDGFEGSTPPLLQNGAEIADASKAMPITGARSLLVRPGAPGLGQGTARFSARLAVAAGDRFVRASVRPVLARNSAWTQFRSPFRIAAGNGAPVMHRLADAAPPITCPTANPADPCYAAPATLEIALPAGATDEVIIDLERVDNCGPPLPEPGFLLDDLRVE
jgi:hypothetical protein